MRVLFPILLCLQFVASSLTAATCVNKYVAQKTGGNRLSLTLLTGTLDFDDAKKLAEEIASGAREPLTWIGDDGKVIAKQWGPLKVVRPMPVACGEKSSGVVVQAIFPTIKNPTKTMTIMLKSDLKVDFEAQND
jgi:hypothetical protein